MTSHLDARMPMDSPTPICPHQGRRTDGKRMLEHADLARLVGGTALPLTLLAQRARTAATNARGVDHTQAAISFSTPFLRAQRASCWASKGPSRLERKVCSINRSP